MRATFLIAAAASLLAVAATAAPGPGEIVIAQAAPFSGPLAPTGTHIRAGIQLYLDRVNAAGGIHGARLKLVSKDDGYKSEETVRLVKELAREAKPVAFAGIVGTGNTEALIKALEGLQIKLPEDPEGFTSFIDPQTHQIVQVQAIGLSQANDKFPPAKMMLGDWKIYKAEDLMPPMELIEKKMKK